MGNSMGDGGSPSRSSYLKHFPVWVKRTAAQELWWVHHRHEWLRDGGDDARRPPATSAAWAAKWSGLFRLRRDRDCPGRFEERPGGPMSAAWYRDV